MRSHIALFMATGLICSALIVLPSHAAATEGLYVVDCPSAALGEEFMAYYTWNCVERSVSYDYNDPGTDWGYMTYGLPAYPAWLATGNFSDASQSEGWDAQDLPPDNATILYVHAIARMAVYESGTKNFKVYYALNASSAEVVAGTADWQEAGSGDRSITGGDPSWITVNINITSNETWTAPMLTSGETWVMLNTTDLTTVTLVIDYIGLKYAWFYAEVPPGEDEGDYGGMFELGSGSMLIFTMGTVGFCGMIGIPPFAVWLWRREGGDKIRAFVMMIVTFTFCFTLFLASLG